MRPRGHSPGVVGAVIQHVEHVLEVTASDGPGARVLMAIHVHVFIETMINTYLQFML